MLFSVGIFFLLQIVIHACTLRVRCRHNCALKIGVEFPLFPVWPGCFGCMACYSTWVEIRFYQNKVEYYLCYRVGDL